MGTKWQALNHECKKAALLGLVNGQKYRLPQGKIGYILDSIGQFCFATGLLNSETIRLKNIQLYNIWKFIVFPLTFKMATLKRDLKVWKSRQLNL